MKIIEIIRIILYGIAIVYLIKYFILMFNKKTLPEERLELFMQLLLAFTIFIVLIGLTHTETNEDSSCSRVPIYMPQILPLVSPRY